MAKRLPWILAVCLMPAVNRAAATREPPLPARFEAGLVFIEMPAPDRSTLHILCASAADSMLLSPEAASRLGLALRDADDADTLTELGPAAKVADATPFMLQRWPVLKMPARFTIVPGVVAFKGWPASADGILGRGWLGAHTWTWDFPEKRLLMRSRRWRPQNFARALPLAIGDPAQAGSSQDAARLPVRIGGEKLWLLFDTGASVVLTPKALAELNDGESALRAANTVAHRIFEAWHVKHPGWPVIDDAQLRNHLRMIKVPAMTLAGLNAGPVWFSERADDSSRIDGSIGGNALKNFRVSVDYPSSRAWLQMNSSRH